MFCKIEITIKNRLGLHARPASRFAQLASEFNSDIYLVRDGEAVDGKSILEILTIACPQGSVLTLTADGEDAGEAVEALRELVAGCLGNID